MWREGEVRNVCVCACEVDELAWLGVCVCVCETSEWAWLGVCVCVTWVGWGEI